ncbi:hypothetical protein [Kitasatospora sp. NPDC008115]|uniref:hypothetical protein n=1 Tax=Kitasatospora sp. NPDC008115 TaxID=3364022 RepID=UPI0036E5C777
MDTPEDACTVSRLPDGSKLADAPAGAGADEPTGSRTAPPLTTEQLAAVATDTAWGQVRDALYG